VVALGLIFGVRLMGKRKKKAKYRIRIELWPPPEWNDIYPGRVVAVAEYLEVG